MQPIKAKVWNEKYKNLLELAKRKWDFQPPSSYGSLCVLHRAGKLLGKLFQCRLLEMIVAAGKLSKTQYNF